MHPIHNMIISILRYDRLTFRTKKPFAIACRGNSRPEDASSSPPPGGHSSGRAVYVSNRVVGVNELNFSANGPERLFFHLCFARKTDERKNRSDPFSGGGYFISKLISNRVEKTIRLVTDGKIHTHASERARTGCPKNNEFFFSKRL